MSKCMRMLMLVALSLLSVSLFAQEDFSADIVNHQKGEEGNAPPRIYVSKGKMRVEEKNARASAVIIDFDAQKMDVLMSERNMYMEIPAGRGPGQRWNQFFRPADVENACADWEKMATHRGGECHKVGADTVNGRNTIKYAATSDEGKHSTIWLDPKIDFPIKWEDDKGGGELQNIKDGALSPSLFEVPSGWQKMQLPPGMAMPSMQPH